MPNQRISQAEFVAMMAMLVSMLALAIDAMLPALPEIATELTPNDPNRAQLIVTSFILGMGVGTFFAGPLSDRFGRKPIVFVGSGIYILGAALAWTASSLELVIAARMLQGLGAAAPRVVAIAVVRDLYQGRAMARLMSFIMTIFTLVPALAPSIGALVISFAGWRAVFVMFIVFAFMANFWFHMRLQEPLKPENRREIKFKTMKSGVIEVFSHASVRTSIAAQTFGFAMLFAMISTVQPIYETTFDQGANFHLWFGMIALLSGSAGFLNSAIVMKLGMRLIVTVTFATQIVLSLAMLSVTQLPVSPQTYFICFVLWQISVFFQTGMSLGNLNALAMEPLGHMAGLAASVIGAVATVLSVVLAVPVGLAFDGTPVPLVFGTLIFATCATLLMLRLRTIEQRQAGGA